MHAPRTIQWIGDTSGFVRLIDQTLLPTALEYRDCHTAEAVWEAIRLAKSVRAMVMLDPGPPAPVPDDLIAQIDVIRPNASEARMLTGIAVSCGQGARGGAGGGAAGGGAGRPGSAHRS